MNACVVREERRRQRLLDGGFMARVDRSAGPDACWPWTGARQSPVYKGRHGGYGYFSVRRKTYYVHRRVLELQLGRRLVPGEVAMHSCDNPPCCNPQHIELGTQAQNIRDMVLRGRWRGPQ